MRILGISGSLREASTNTRLLAAAARLAPAGAEMRVTGLLDALPPFSPDQAPSALPAVAKWVEEVAAADGIVICTPEYAGGYPGVLKNALDWLVGTDAFIAKPFFLLNASPRGVIAQTTLTKVLETMSGVHVRSATTTIPLLGSKRTIEEILAEPDFAAMIRGALQTFVAEIERRRSSPAA